MSDEADKKKRREFSGWMGSAESAEKREAAKPQAPRRGRPPAAETSEGAE